MENKSAEECFEQTNNKIPKDVTYYKASDFSVLKDVFLVEMPKDFFEFYDFLNANGAIVETLENVNLELIGPYDLLLGKLPKVDDKELYLVHWRFFYDPPEFQAVLKEKGKSEYHIGYFRDTPKEKPVFVGSNDSAENCHITILADNIFGAVYQYLQKQTVASPVIDTASERMMHMIEKYAQDNGIDISPYNMQKRKETQLTNTFHQAGMVVPYDVKSQLGYRPLIVDDETLKKIFAALSAASTKEEKDAILSELEPVIYDANVISFGEFNFGTNLELGLAFFCSGLKELESDASNSLSLAYDLMNRRDFEKIIEAHMKYRRKGPHMSIFA